MILGTTTPSQAADAVPGISRCFSLTGGAALQLEPGMRFQFKSNLNQSPPQMRWGVTLWGTLVRSSLTVGCWGKKCPDSVGTHVFAGVCPVSGILERWPESWRSQLPSLSQNQPALVQGQR